MADFNRQRTVYMTKQEYDLLPDIGKKLESEYPGKQFKKPGSDEYSLSAIVRFLLKREGEA